MSSIPTDRSYTSSHEWLKIDGNTITMGITDHAQEQLGDLVFVDLPEAGGSFAQGDEMVTLESVKAAADVFCPVNGTVTEVNEALADNPELLNSDPYDTWLVKLESDGAGLDNLLDADGYQAHVDAE